MATVSNAERNAICDQMFRVAGEDAARVGAFLDFVQTGLTGINWQSIMRTRAASWAPYVSSGLSITAFCDEAVRYAAAYAYART
jgi:hypothetical protein